MLNWNEIVQQNIIRNYDKTCKITRPLRDHFGISYFTYHRIDTQGNYNVLLDRPDFAEQYVENQLYKNDPFLKHPSVYEPGLCLWETHCSEDHVKKSLDITKPLFDIDMCVVLIEKSDQAVEFFGFVDNHKNTRFNKLYLNHPHLLKAFANYFKKELNLIIHEQEPGYLPQIKGNNFFCDIPILPRLEADSNVDFLSDLGLGEYHRRIELLSKRERECLTHLLVGRTAKEIAASLSISYRTVESYLESIKNKLGCWSKNELCEIAQDFNRLGLLP